MSGQIRYDQRYLSLPEVYRLGSFSAAGERLALTPSAVAQQMHSLERELRVTLFRKGDRRLIPTPECETVMKYIGRMQALGRQLEDELTNTRRGRLRVGITPSAAVSLPGLLTRYEEQQPGVQMTVTTAPAAVLYGSCGRWTLIWPWPRGTAPAPAAAAFCWIPTTWPWWRRPTADMPGRGSSRLRSCGRSP